MENSNELAKEFAVWCWGKEVGSDVSKIESLFSSFLAEKLIKKDYEILEVKGKYGSIFFYKERYDSDLKDKSIFKIKRLSDNVIFTIGDVVDGFSYNSRAIEGFILCGHKIEIKQHGGKSELEDIKKSKRTPLFRTEDGVEVFEGDTIYGINTDWKVFSHYTNLEAKIKNWGINPIFSTEIAAKNYIKENKKKYSLKDINEALIRTQMCLNETTRDFREKTIKFLENGN